MHQILGLRSYFDEKKGKWIKTDNTFAKRGWSFNSVQDIFENLDKILKQIPEGDRWNLFYTVAFCTEGKREFREQNVIVFDIDSIDHKVVDMYHEVVTSCLGVRVEDVGIVNSGNGLHYIIGLSTPIQDPLFFEHNRHHYTAICAKINAALKRAELPGESDPSVFDPRRILRLPGTINRKEGKPEKKCFSIRGGFLNQVFDLPLLSGIPKITATEQVSTQALRKYPTPDTAAILDGCDFLKYCKEKPNEISEAQWYAMLSIVPRLPPSGRTLAHDYSKGHASYSAEETETKIDQALSASGPRTCKNIEKIWTGCQTCPNFEKVNSPIMIQGEKYIKTRDSGFHTCHIDDSGKLKVGKPCYEDMRLYFEEIHPYLTLGESGICLLWNGKYWDEFKDLYLEGFAQLHFEPKATTAMTKEFKSLICRTNIRDTDWFLDTTNRKVNFNNGVLNLDTMEFLPHSIEYGFRYVLKYDYDPKAKAPQFEKFMLTLMKGRQELVDILLEYAGYSFSNDECWIQQALLMTGEGSNGKSTFMDILKALAGKANYSTVTIAELKADTSRTMLDGKLFNLAEETPTSTLIDSTILKSLITGGETTVKILYKQPYTIFNRAKFMFACNTLPKTKDTTRGYSRRWLIIPFEVSFEGTQRDPFIKDRLLTELPGIFNLVIEGYKRLVAQRAFTQSHIIEEELENYRNDLDTVKAWYDDCVEHPLKDPTDVARVSLGQLYASYRIHTELKGEYPETQATVARRLKHLMPEWSARRKRDRIKGKKETFYHGIRFADGSSF